MKVCIFSDTYPPVVGGLAVSVRRNAVNLAAKGHEVHVVTPGRSLTPGNWSSEPDGPVTVHRFGVHPRVRETLVDWFDLAVELDSKNRFELFHGYFIAYAGYMAASVARYRGAKSVVSARGNDIDTLPFDEKRAVFVHKALEWADAIVAVTQDLARKAAALSGRDDIYLIHNGVSTDFFKPLEPDPNLKSALGLDDTPVLGFIGEARAKKGFSRMLRIFADLQEKIPCQLLMVGGVRKNEREVLEFFRRRHPGLSLILQQELPHEQMPGYYALCDVVMLPSLRDGLPNSLLEAMACGRPVVASAVGGMPDVVTDGHDGCLLPPRDDEAWVKALVQTLQNPELSCQLGEAARQSVADRFSIEAEQNKTISLYETLLAL